MREDMPDAKQTHAQEAVAGVQRRPTEVPALDAPTLSPDIVCSGELLCRQEF